MSAHTFLRSWFVGLTLGIRSLVYLHCGLTLTLALAPAPVVYADASFCEFPDELDSDEPDGDECRPVVTNRLKSLGSAWSSDTNICPLSGQSSGDPIDNTTGNVYETETDYAGAGAFPLVFSRLYNSQSTVTSGPLGANWSHSFSAHLVRKSATVVQAVRADQKTLTFTLINGQWTADADVNSRLTQASSLWLYTTGDDTVEKYDASGKLLRIVSRAGLTQYLTYNAQGLLASVSDPFGRVLTFTYDAAGRIVKMTDPAGQVYIYSYDATNNPSTVTYPDGTSRTYVYGISAFPHALHGLMDENGVHFATWNYDSKGLAVSSLHAGDVDKVTVKYDFPHGGTYVTDARGNTSTYGYFSALGAAHTESAEKPSTSFLLKASSFWSYDAQGNISTYMDYLNNTTTFTYDLTRNLETSRTEAVGTPQKRTITTTWHPTFRLPATVTEPNNRVTTFTYDARGNLLQKTLTAGALSRTWLYTYNANGQVLTIDGPRTDVADVTHFAYDSKGNLLSITDALGHSTKLTAYDVHGRPLTIVDPNGLTTTLKYDLRGRLFSRQVGSELTTYSYDKAGQLLKQTHPDGSFESFTYDGAHRVRAVTDTLGNKIAYTWDLADNLIKAQAFDPQGHLVRTRSQTFDTLNRLAQAIGAQGQSTAFYYDDNDNLLEITDPLGHTAARGYDPLNRLFYSDNPNADSTLYGYDANDNLVSVTDPLNHATTYFYDGLGNQRHTTSPDTGLTYNTRDAAGNVLSSTDARGLHMFYTYDALNRLTSVRFASGTVAFTYDQGTNGIGHLTQMTDPSGQTNWVYDQHGRALSKTQKVGTLSLVTHYSYDPSGRLASLTYPSGQVITLTYTANRQVAQISANGTALLSGIHYEPFGPANSWFWGNGTADIRQFDLDGRLVAYDLGPSRHRQLTYDAAGRITDYTDTDPTQDQQFGYDFADQVTGSEVNGSDARPYAYDKNGNRTSLNGSDTYTYAASSNQLLSISGTHPRTYTYDAAGNITSDGTNQFVYDGRGRLTQVTTSTGTIKYKINGLGQRVGKPGRFFVYDEAGHLLGEYNAQGQALEETVYLGDMPVAVLQGTARYFLYADQLNAPRAIMDTSNTIVWHWDSEPFGTGLPQGPLTYNLRGPGQYFDQESGLFYNYSRDYDPLTGRYIESDPIGLAGGINPYVYVRNNPVSYTDPAGLQGPLTPLVIFATVLLAVSAASNVGEHLKTGSDSPINAVNETLQRKTENSGAAPPETPSPKETVKSLAEVPKAVFLGAGPAVVEGVAIRTVGGLATNFASQCPQTVKESRAIYGVASKLTAAEHAAEHAIHGAEILEKTLTVPTEGTAILLHGKEIVDHNLVGEKAHSEHGSGGGASW